jgi:hypothetical protein
MVAEAAGGSGVGSTLVVTPVGAVEAAREGEVATAKGFAKMADWGSVVARSAGACGARSGTVCSALGAMVVSAADMASGAAIASGRVG